MLYWSCWPLKSPPGGGSASVLETTFDVAAGHARSAWPLANATRVACGSTVCSVCWLEQAATSSADAIVSSILLDAIGRVPVRVINAGGEKHRFALSDDGAAAPPSAGRCYYIAPPLSQIACVHAVGPGSFLITGWLPPDSSTLTVRSYAAGSR